MATTQPASTGKKKKIQVTKVVNGVPMGTEEIEVDDNGLSWGPNNKHRILNTKIPRSDGPAKATGTAKYTFDIKVPGMLHGRFLGSPHAHATIKSMDTSAAEKIPGVKAVLNVGVKEIKYEGQPIAAVAAVTSEIAEDAIRAIVVDYDVKPHVVKADDAMKPEGLKLFPSDKPQVKGDAEKVDAALANCAAVVEAEYRTPMWHHCCLETHGVVVDYSGGDTATVYASTQGTFQVPPEAARELGLKGSDVTSIVHHMGGGFGSKFGSGVTGTWAYRLSKAAQAPVKMMLTRRDEFLTSGNGPGSIHKFKAGVSKEGILEAMHTEQWSMAGIGKARIGAQPYQYKAGVSFGQQTQLYTNEDASCAMRAPGHPQASFAMESLMDELAEKIGMDPIAFRKKNIVGEDGIAWSRQLDKGAETIGWSKRKMKAGADEGTLKRGFGCGIGAWGGAGSPKCVVDVKISRDGGVVVECGTQDLGTGTRTYMRAIAAEELGLEYADVVERIGDSKLGNANASGGSTTAASLAPAVKDASNNAKMEMAKLVAPLLGAQADEVLFADRKISGAGKSLTWAQACAALPAAGIAARGEWKPGLSGKGAHGASFAEVEVDTETGHVQVIKMCHVQDGGLILNRLAAESQINGGMIQSVGGALYEGRYTDADLGVMLNPAFNDYKLPGTLEIPELIPVIDDGDPREAVIGIAEPANIPGIGAIANAVYNACGVRVRELPITPDKILNGLAKA